MKKLLCTILSTLMILTLGGCGKAADNVAADVQQTEEVSDSETMETNEKDDVAVKDETSVSSEAAVNEFLNGTPLFNVNCVSVNPKHVYYDNGNLIMEGFVNNGFNRPVFNIQVNSISLSDKGGNKIAECGFGMLNNLTIGAGGYAEWQFTFPQEYVNNSNADLSELYCKCSTDYRY